MHVFADCCKMWGKRYSLSQYLGRCAQTAQPMIRSGFIGIMNGFYTAIGCQGGNSSVHVYRATCGVRQRAYSLCVLLCVCVCLCVRVCLSVNAYAYTHLFASMCVCVS